MTAPASPILMQRPPGPPPVAGNLIARLRFFQPFMTDVLGGMADLFRQYGDTLFFTVGTEPVLMTCDPDTIHAITVSKAGSFVKGLDYTNRDRGLAAFLGDGLLTSDGEFWKRQRKLVAPSLHAKRVENYAEAMVSAAERQMRDWEPGQERDIDLDMMRVTLNIVTGALFQTDLNDRADEIGRAMDILQRMNANFIALPKWMPTPKHRRERWALATLNDLMYGLIAAWQRDPVDRGDLMAMLMLARDEDGAGMTPQQVRDELMTLILAGHETTANALNWIWLMLGSHPEAEARLHHELDRVLGGRLPTLADLKNLPYTDQVIKEAMRLYPPAWSFGRRSTAEVEIAPGWTIPAGTSVNVSIIHMHRSPRWWDEPVSFRPERFAPENEGAIHKRAYLPFGAGPRVCVGNAFAQMEAKLLLGAFASRWRLELTHFTEVDPLITLRPRDGVRMRLIPRTPGRVVA